GLVDPASERSAQLAGGVGLDHPALGSPATFSSEFPALVLCRAEPGASRPVPRDTSPSAPRAGSGPKPSATSARDRLDRRPQLDPARPFPAGVSASALAPMDRAT